MINKNFLKDNIWNRIKMNPLIFIFSLFILYGCHNSFDEKAGSDAQMGTLLLSINGDNAGRTITPSTVLSDFIQFKLEFTAKAAGNSSFNKTWANGSGTVDLAVGTWELTVTAYLQGENESLLEAAKSAPKTLAVSSGVLTPVNIQLFPIDEGSGTFNWNVGINGSFESVVMEIWQLGNVKVKTFVFVQNGITQTANLNSGTSLDSGWYRVDFVMSNGEEEVALSEILHIYKNMDSFFEEVLTDYCFPVTLISSIFGLWDESQQEWNFTGTGIATEHFSYLGINGVDDNNFDGIVQWFNALCAAEGAPANLAELKTLVDAALIGMASEDDDFVDAVNYANQSGMELAISALAVNSTVLAYTWDNDITVSVQIGGYEVEIVFTSIITITAQPAPTTSKTVGSISGSLSVSASVTGGATLSYQWYSNTTNSNSGGTVITSATSASFTIPTTLTAGTYYYFCEVSATGGASPARSSAATVTVVVPIEMVWIPAGTFMMGSPDGTGGDNGSEAEPGRWDGYETLHQVTLTSGFYMSNCQVTQEQYEAVMGYNPSYFTTDNGYPPATGETQGRRPVECVSWYDAIEFCNALSEQEGLTPYYDIDKMQEDPNNTNEYDPYKWLITTNSAANGYRLPTEAQWEYACRAETTTAFNNGNNNYEDTEQVDEVAWYYYNSDYMTHEVGKKAANVWGLYDMHGNVWEWCWDWWEYNLGTEESTDPTGMSAGSFRVIRGGSWSDDAQSLRSAYRYYHDYPSSRGSGIGFRLLRP